MSSNYLYSSYRAHTTTQLSETDGGCSKYSSIMILLHFLDFEGSYCREVLDDPNLFIFKPLFI